MRLPRQLKHTGIAITLGVVSSIFPAVSDAGTLYRWNDAKGRPVISDRQPPVGTPYTVLNDGRFGVIKKAPTTTPNEPTQQAVSENQRAKKSVAGSNDEKVVVEKHPELCAQAKENIFKLETFPRMRVEDDDGTVRFMSDAERAAQLKTAREVAKANCQ